MWHGSDFGWIMCWYMEHGMMFDIDSLRYFPHVLEFCYWAKDLGVTEGH
jgi:hypothetical protein